MAHAIQSRASSPANELRDALDQVERLIVNPTAQSVEPLLTLMDQIQQLFENLLQADVDLQPEQARWNSIQNRLASKPGPVAAAASAAGGMSKLRAKHPPAENQWWHLDAEVGRRRRQMAQRLLVTVGSIVGIVALVFWVLNTFFPPKPETLVLLDATSTIEDHILIGEWENARAAAEAGLEQLPDEPELLIWHGVLSEQVGDAASADESLEKAEAILSDRLIAFWVTLANQRLQVGNLDGAEEAALQAIEIAPEEAQGYFVLGSIAEVRGDIPTAIDLFDQTFILAEEDNPQLAVIAKVRMGTLMQQVNPFEQQEESSATTPAANP
ncbi:hypothetical protein KFU94_35335 [Chloroflexi bacterium TSY]|nr:hypothetical protein [Chloroflexi bacterium TSY]